MDEIISLNDILADEDIISYSNTQYTRLLDLLRDEMMSYIGLYKLLESIEDDKEFIKNKSRLIRLSRNIRSKSLDVMEDKLMDSKNKRYLVKLRKIIER